MKIENYKPNCIFRIETKEIDWPPYKANEKIKVLLTTYYGQHYRNGGLGGYTYALSHEIKPI